MRLLAASGRAARECRVLAGILAIGVLIVLIGYGLGQPAPRLPVCGPHVTGMCISAWDRNVYGTQPARPAHASR